MSINDLKLEEIYNLIPYLNTGSYEIYLYVFAKTVLNLNLNELNKYL